MADRADLKDRFLGAMLCHCLGDCLGAPWEGTEPFTATLAPSGPLSYTDDTEMMINLTRSILRDRALIPDSIAREFVNGFNSFRGYGPGTIKTLELIKKGLPYQEATRAVFPEGSMGNGAAMRVTPVGLLYHRDIDALKEAVKLQAEITHAHPLAVQGATVVAIAVALAARGFPIEDVPEEMLRYLDPGPYRDALRSLQGLISKEGSLKEAIEIFGCGVLAQESTLMALYISVISEGQPLRAIELAIRAGGDTDTIGAMAGAITGASAGAAAVPDQLLSTMEGYAVVKRLAEELYSLFLHRYSV